MKTIQRPEGYMENPFIGKDGKDYHSIQALNQANDDHNQGYTLVKALLIPAIAIGAFIGGASTAYSFSKPAVLTKQDVDKDGRLDYVVNGSNVFLDKGQEEYQPIPSESIRDLVSSDKFKVVYDRTFDPEYTSR